MFISSLSEICLLEYNLLSALLDIYIGITSVDHGITSD